MSNEITKTSSLLSSTLEKFGIENCDPAYADIIASLCEKVEKQRLRIDKYESEECRWITVDDKNMRQWTSYWNLMRKHLSRFHQYHINDVKSQGGVLYKIAIGENTKSMRELLCDFQLCRTICEIGSSLRNLADVRSEFELFFEQAEDMWNETHMTEKKRLSIENFEAEEYNLTPADNESIQAWIELWRDLVDLVRSINGKINRLKGVENSTLYHIATGENYKIMYKLLRDYNFHGSISILCDILRAFDEFRTEFKSFFDCAEFTHRVVNDTDTDTDTEEESD